MCPQLTQKYMKMGEKWAKMAEKKSIVPLSSLYPSGCLSLRREHLFNTIQYLEMFYNSPERRHGQAWSAAMARMWHCSIHCSNHLTCRAQCWLLQSDWRRSGHMDSSHPLVRLVSRPFLSWSILAIQSRSLWSEPPQGPWLYKQTI